jgi:hypothetical protein
VGQLPGGLWWTVSFTRQKLIFTLAITKNGITKLAAPPSIDLEKITSDKKIEDKEILEILERPLSKSTGTKKNKKKKKKVAKKEDEDSDEDSDD